MAGSVLCILLLFVYSSFGEEKPKPVVPFIEEAETQPNYALRQGPPVTTTEAPKPKCVCSKIYDPVCGTNNKSYFNTCIMECDTAAAGNVTVLHQGNCIPF